MMTLCKKPQSTLLPQSIWRPLFLLLLLLTFGMHETVNAQEPPVKKKYNFKKEKIDVVIPCARKDIPTLEMCIKSIRRYGKDVRRIIVVSDEQFSSSAEWFDEKCFPFTREDLALAIFGNEEEARQFIEVSRANINWIYQQFLKLYAAFVIPNISSNVLILDSDTVFLRPVSFLHEKRYAFFNPGTEYHLPYFAFMHRAIPGLSRVFSEHSGISHHMLFQKEILEDLFATIKAVHGDDVIWKSLCRSIDVTSLYNSCMSEYELYFNFAFSRTKQVKIRQLRWKNVSSIEEIKQSQREGYDFVSCHSYLRKN
jgi:hypothetical protein